MTPIPSKMADEIELQIITMGNLAELLLENGALKGSIPGPQIDDRGEEAIKYAICALSKTAHDGFCRLTSHLEAQEKA